MSSGYLKLMILSLLKHRGVVRMCVISMNLKDTKGKESKAWLNMACNCKPNAVYFPYFDSRIYKGRHCFRTRGCEQERCLPDLISPQ